MTPRTRLAGYALSLLLVVPPVVAADVPANRRAIDRGVAFLKKQQDAKGTWTYFESTPGATALAGLTLLECDVPPTDRAVQRAAEAVRPATITLTHTYSLSLAVLFLDRLSDPGDVPLIQSMAVRLLAGQKASGGWTYDCPPNTREETRRLTTLLSKRRQTSGKEAKRPEGRPVLPRELENQLKLSNLQAGPQQTDNSNTKFATLALWVARRHGVPVEAALARVERRFRTTQNSDGGWGYLPGTTGAMAQSSATMTCAGLLGLAFGHGSAAETSLRTEPKPADGRTPPGRLPDPAQDPSIRSGLLLLGAALGQPLDRARHGQPTLFNRKGDEYYFLWALERVAVAYGLETVGNKDWYAWGSSYLLARQRKDGGWDGQYAACVDTCFALLFLSRANLSRDLTATLKGRVADPGDVTLKNGGVGGKEVGAKTVPPGDEPREKSPGASPSPAQVKTASPTSPDGAAWQAEIARLSAALLQAPADRREELIAKYQAEKGVIYTQALAAAIPKLSDPSKKKARAALAERMARMTARTLRGRLKDEDVEIRRAAALACAAKDDNALARDLIPILEDAEPLVARAAHAALRSLTGQDFGPAAGADAGERSKAVKAWEEWWKKQSGKPSGG